MDNAITNIEAALNRYQAATGVNRECANRALANEAQGTDWKWLAELAAIADRMATDAEAERARDARWHREAKEVKAAAKASGKCTRCGGLGILHAFKAVNGGVCFECEGSGLDEAA